jgi:hypothetical protein
MNLLSASFPRATSLPGHFYLAAFTSFIKFPNCRLSNDSHQRNATFQLNLEPKGFMNGTHNVLPILSETLR